jgi:hypothetical protein
MRGIFRAATHDTAVGGLWEMLLLSIGPSFCRQCAAGTGAFYRIDIPFDFGQSNTYEKQGDPKPCIQSRSGGRYPGGSRLALRSEK